MSSGASSLSKKRGQYVSRACNECRRRRCKCDGGQPACGTCVFYGRECSWSTENDARRPATKQLVESLHVKIQMLEAELAQLKSQHGIPITDSGSVPPSPLDNKPVLPVEPPEHSNVERPTPAPGQTTTVMYRYIFEIDSSVPTNEQSKDAHLSLVCHWNRYLPSVPQLTRFEHDTLLLRFFKYGVCWLHCMIPETFLHDMLYSLTSEPSAAGNQVRLQHYTPILHCSILAFAAAFSENPDIRSLPVRAQFAHHAKQWLDSEFERPTMSLVRALALLAEYHAGIGEREAGFMYMGMSFCAARSLIVNMDKEQWHSDAAAPFPESISCDWHYWSSFAQDKLMALEYRQEYDMPIPHQGVSLPSIDVESDNQPWSDGAAGFPPRLTTKVFFESCKLMVISTKIIDYLHNRDHDAANERAVINIHLQLDTWFNNLPRELLVWARSTSPLPHMIVLHVCYWYLIICLHQPFYGRAVGADGGSEGSAGAMADGTPGAESSADSGVGLTPIHDLSVKMSDRATHKIVQLLQMFEQQHGMAFFPRNMIHVIQQCGLALLREAACVPATATKKRSNALEGVSACMRALRGAARSWPWAGRLASDLEGKLSDAGVNVTTSPFVPTMTVPTTADNDPSTMDISQTLYQFIHVWEPMAAEGSVGAEPMANISGVTLQAGPSGLSMQAGPSGLGLQTGQPRMGSQGPASGTSSHHPRPADPVRRGGLAATGGNQPGLETHSYNMLPFAGTPSSSSTSSYSANEGMWGHPLFEQ